MIKPKVISGETEKLAALDLPVTLSTAHVQACFQSGNDVRKWAKNNGVKLTVRKGEIEFS